MEAPTGLENRVTKNSNICSVAMKGFSQMERKKLVCLYILWQPWYLNKHLIQYFPFSPSLLSLYPHWSVSLPSSPVSPSNYKWHDTNVSILCFAIHNYCISISSQASGMTSGMSVHFVLISAWRCSDEHCCLTARQSWV